MWDERGRIVGRNMGREEGEEGWRWEWEVEGRLWSEEGDRGGVMGVREDGDG